MPRCFRLAGMLGSASAKQLTVFLHVLNKQMITMITGLLSGIGLIITGHVTPRDMSDYGHEGTSRML